MKRQLTALALLALVPLPLACAENDDGGGGGPGATSVGGGGSGASGGGSVVGCEDYSEVGSSAACDGLCPISNEAICTDDVISPDCADLPPGAAVDTCGVVLDKPEVAGELLELQRSSNVMEHAGSGPPDVSCTSEAPIPPGTPQLVTLQGFARIFSSGCESSALQIEIYTVNRDGTAANDGTPDQLVATATFTGTDCTVDGEPEPHDSCADPKLAGQRWECPYEYAGVPTETELLVKTHGVKWAEVYEYNVYVPNSEVVNGRWDKHVLALAQDDYQLLPQVTMGKTMEPGRGAILGEVHDCGDVRLINAIVGSDTGGLLTYYTDDETRPLPDTSAPATSTLGLYTLFDVEPGAVHVAAAGVVEGALVGLGFFEARVFPNAVSAVTFRGHGAQSP